MMNHQVKTEGVWKALNPEVNLIELTRRFYIEFHFNFRGGYY